MFGKPVLRLLEVKLWTWNTPQKFMNLLQEITWN